MQEKLEKIRGMKFKSWGRTFSEGDFTLMNNLCWTIDWLHTNKARMRERTQFQDRILPGPCVLALVGGLMMTVPILQTIWDNGLGIKALLTYEDIKFLTPVFPGDNLDAEFEFISANLTSSPDKGILKIKQIASKQTGERILEATQVYLVHDDEQSNR